jgi:predicted small secreted protein
MQKSKFLAGLVAAVTVIALVGSVRADSPKNSTAEAKKTNDAFERLKKMAGDWQDVAPKDEASKGQTLFSYRVVGGGSAVIETVFPGTDMEMVSVYHKDGDKLVMTHYCCCGNQPHLQASAGSDKDSLAFELTGGCNLNPAKDTHMHAFRVRFQDADHVHSECDIYSKGKVSEKHGFDLVRKK